MIVPQMPRQISKNLGILLCLFLLLLPSCGSSKRHPDSLRAGAEILAIKQIQTRKFDAVSSEDLFAACQLALKELDFDLDVIQPELGLLVASNLRVSSADPDLVELVELTMFLSTLGAVNLISTEIFDRVSVVLRQTADSDGASHLVRVTFQRVTTEHGQITTSYALNDEDRYVKFFDQLSKLLESEAHRI